MPRVIDPSIVISRRPKEAGAGAGPESVVEAVGILDHGGCEPAQGQEERERAGVREGGA